MRFQYRLSIDETLEPFLPEIGFVFSVLDERFDFERTDDPDSAVIHYGPSAPADAIQVPSLLFPDLVKASPQTGVSLAPKAIDGLLERAQRFFPSATREPKLSGPIEYDAVGLVFFMLSRIEERDAPSLDRYGRFPYSESLAAQTGYHQTPVVDIALRELAGRLSDAPRIRPARPYRVLPTHDVDSLKGYHRPHEPLRYALGDIVKRRQLLRGLQRLRAYAPGEPKQSFSRLMRLSERYGLTSRFFFMGPSLHRMDSPYAATMPVLLGRTAAEVVERGHVVGIHPGFETMKDGDALKRQKTDLERIVGRSVTEGRQHALRFDIMTTPRAWERNGMKVDFTLSFPEVPGFRNGSTHAVPYYDLVERRLMSLRAQSTPVMEFGLFGGKYNDLSIEDAIDLCRPTIDACRREHGDLVVLQHTGRAFAEVDEFYERLLALAA